MEPESSQSEEEIDVLDANLKMVPLELTLANIGVSFVLSGVVGGNISYLILSLLNEKNQDIFRIVYETGFDLMRIGGSGAAAGVLLFMRLLTKRSGVT